MPTQRRFVCSVLAMTGVLSMPSAAEQPGEAAREPVAIEKNPTPGRSDTARDVDHADRLGSSKASARPPLTGGLAKPAQAGAAVRVVETRNRPAESPARPDQAIKFFPLPAGQVPQRVFVGADQNEPEVVAKSERLAYSNTLGRFAASFPAGIQVADDISLNAPTGCNLRRYSFQATGKADPNGADGAYMIEFALYDNCPLAGGEVIPGTVGSVSFTAAQVALNPLANIVVVVPDGIDVPIPPTVWLGVTVDRRNSGFIMGAPALVGFSGDVMDFPLANCSGNLGGFPKQPHASFNAEVFVDGTCPEAFLAYRNMNPGRGGVNEGRNVRFADDLQLQVDSCELIGYEIGVRGQAAWDLDIRRDRDGVPGTVIAGTEGRFFSLSDNAQIGHILIDPPILLNSTKVWVTVKPNARTGKWILVGRDATVGRTAITFAVLDDDTGQWDIRFPDRADEHGGFYANLFCAGQPPVGACCDMYQTDENGDSVCREVPEMNCPFPVRGSVLRPGWVEGATCDLDPFPHPCGQSACCRPDDTCENLTQNECNAVEPVELVRDWQRGRYCDEGFQDCSFNACLQWEGSCMLAHESPGCEHPKCCTDVCEADPFCCRLEWDRTCIELAGWLCPLILPDNDTCAPTERYEGALLVDVPGSGLTLAWRATTDPNDPGFCCHNGFEQICVEGDHDGDACTTNEDCQSGGTCRIRTPQPGKKALATHWYRFTIPERGEGEPEFVSIQLDTCQSPGDTSVLDSLIEVFSIADSDLGRCQDIGRCTDGSLCRVTNNDCADGSRCLKRDEACSVSAQDCPLGATCDFDLEAACDRTTSLGVIACNDDAADGCGDPANRGKLSRLCLEDLERGQTYIILVASKDEDSIGELRLRLTPVISCVGAGDAVANDYCRRALPLPFHATIEIVVPFDLAEATWDCEPSDQTCLQMQTDVWYEYRPDFSGEATFELCGLDNESTPDTCVAIYDGCDCPPAVGPALGCSCINLSDAECILGALETIDVVGGQCYKVRVSGARGEKGAADLNIRFQGNDCDEDFQECPFNACLQSEGSCMLAHEFPGCENPDCCVPVCEADPFCCLVEWDRLCVELAGSLCPFLLPENDTCAPKNPLDGALLVDVPGTGLTPAWRATTDPSDPGFCCHRESPGNQGLGTVWYKFFATHTSVELTTHYSDPPARELLIQVFAVGDPTSDETACDSLESIACLDEQNLAGGNEPVQKLCVKNLVPGDLYYVMVAAKTPKDQGLYRLTIDAPCEPRVRHLNDNCADAIRVTESATLFDFADTTIDCPIVTCQSTLRRDLWFDYVAQETGTIKIDVCPASKYAWGGGNITVYTGCECPASSASELLCEPFGNDDCSERNAAQIDVVAGQCYKIRLGMENTFTFPGELCIGCRYCPRGDIYWRFVGESGVQIDGMVDARRPHDPNDNTILEGIDVLRATGPALADPGCWSICETILNPDLHPPYPPEMERNQIVDVEVLDDRQYLIHLKRPLSPGEITTITYTEDSGFQSTGRFTAHPGDVNGDGTTDADDVAEWVDFLENRCIGNLCPGPGNPVKWPHQVDINRDGRINPTDLLELIDLLIGTGAYEPWLGSTVPGDSTTCP